MELRVVEVLDFAAGELLDYSYTVYRGSERILWYDPQPHPHDPTLASTFPHHRHEPPDIKHNRRPAPGMAFDSPNLPRLINEIRQTGLARIMQAVGDVNHEIHERNDCMDGE